MDTSKSHSLVEQHGIDAVPKAERSKNWVDLFVIYTGMNIAISALLAGGILVPGLGWTEALFVMIFGYIAVGALMVLVGHVGVDHGVPAVVASRASLGHPLGSDIASLVLIISLVGWFAVNAEIGAIAMNTVTQTVFGFSSLETMILFLGITNAVVAIIGFESIKWVSRLSVPLLLAVLVWVLITLLRDYPLQNLLAYEPTGEVSVATALHWTIGGFGVGIFIASDYSRYVRSRRDNWAGVMLGMVPSSVFLVAMGALSKLATGDSNPISGMEALGLGIPAMAVIVFSTWTTNDINLYSSGIALTNVVPKLNRWTNTLILSVAGTTLAMFRLTENFTGFLELLGNLYGPLIGVLVADYYLVRKSQLYDPARMLTTKISWICPPSAFVRQVEGFL